MKRRIILSLIVCLCLSIVPLMAADDDISGELVIFHAGSLAVPFKKISEAFNEIYPDVKILREAAGSRACARKISELDRPADIMASADYTVIDQLLIPEHASWNIRFASNEMAVVYHHESRGASDINTSNWYEVLGRENVHFGRSNPNDDPCGYRAILTLKLAEQHYGINGLADQLIGKDNRYIRPKETDLLALLESNTIDYIFLYRSVAQQHGLEYVVLPDEVNLKKTELADFYKSATVQISGKKPGQYVTKKGAPMVYGVTIPKSSPNPKAAMAFMRFLLLPNNGMAIMEELGQPSTVPSYSDSYEQIPSELKIFASSSK